MSTVGFVGLGLMGQGFTQRLAEKGYRLVGFDIDDEKVRAASAWGVAPAASAAAVAQAADVLLVCVINTAAVEAVTTGPRGFTAAPGITGKICVDVSTTELDATHRVAAALHSPRHGLRRCTGLGWPRRGQGRYARDHGGRSGPGDREDHAADAGARPPSPTWVGSALGRRPSSSTRPSC